MEYSGPSVNGACCSYATLNNYNMGSSGMSPPVPATTVSGYYVVPSWNPRVNLVKEGNSCSGYPSILGAYGKNAGSCDPQYHQQPCNNM